ncbi:unnamed protein product [Closterium sp. Naga37s-1]|nr:unnamed protein product [Closterium sp. Naga37s-1]
MRRLPESVIKLPQLQVLRVMECKRLARLPSSSLRSMPTLLECDFSECPLLSRRDTRGLPPRGGEVDGEEGEGEGGEGAEGEEAVEGDDDGAGWGAPSDDEEEEED